MDTVDSDGMPPPDLRLSWYCERLKCTPDTGGINDQDYATMHRMVVLSNIYNALNRFRNLKGEQIHSLSQSERGILKYLATEGLLFNA